MNLLQRWTSLGVGALLLTTTICQAGHWELDLVYSQPTGETDPEVSDPPIPPAPGRHATASGLDTYTIATVEFGYAHAEATGSENWRWVWKADMAGEQPPQNAVGLVIGVGMASAVAAAGTQGLLSVANCDSSSNVFSASANAHASSGSGVPPFDEKLVGPVPGAYGSLEFHHGDTLTVSQSAHSETTAWAATMPLTPGAEAAAGGSAKTEGALYVVPDYKPTIP